MAPFTVIVANLLVAASLAAGATVSPRLRGAATGRQALAGVLLGGLALADGILLAAFVFGEDDYRGMGISRWDAYRSPGGALGPMFVLSLVLLGAAAALLVVAGLGGRVRLLGATALACGAACTILVTATILGFSLN